MTSRFDRIIDRKNTGSIKYDFATRRGVPEQALPMWVADMDFQAPPAVIEILEQSARHGIFGYSEGGQPYLSALHSWFTSRFQWDFDDSWLVKTPGVVFAIATAVRSLTKAGDAVLIQQPVYYPFASIVKSNKRQLVVNALTEKRGHYAMDLNDFEQKIVKHKVKMFLLCSPHNPVGRVWTPQELTALGQICMRHGVLVVADEIHADFIYPGHRHTLLTQALPELKDQTVLCTAPSKTFNLAGLQAANIFIANPTLRRRFQAEIQRLGASLINTMGLAACQAAYTHGEPWLEELLVYLHGNLDFLEHFLLDRLPQIRLVRPQGTYLAWLDFRGLFDSENQRRQFLLSEARLWLDEGTLFGPQGTGFERLNFACPRAVLRQALEQLEKAWQKRQP